MVYCTLSTIVTQLVQLQSELSVLTRRLFSVSKNYAMFRAVLPCRSSWVPFAVDETVVHVVSLEMKKDTHQLGVSLRVCQSFVVDDY